MQKMLFDRIFVPKKEPMMGKSLIHSSGPKQKGMNGIQKGTETSKEAENSIKTEEKRLKYSSKRPKYGKIFSK
jgi:hypothetical protein